MPTPPSADLVWHNSEINDRVKEAVAFHWLSRKRQKEKQEASGKNDAGTRGSATGGRHLDGFRTLLDAIAEEADLLPKEPRTKRLGTVLPGWYRAHKAWDWLLIQNGQLIAAVEFKSMVGSVGNNLNNRAEEALGLATDFWKAHDEGLFTPERLNTRRREHSTQCAFEFPSPPARPPFVGYVFLLGAQHNLADAVKRRRPRYVTLDEFDGSTYYTRFGELCRRLVAPRGYTAVAFIQSEPDGSFSEPFPEVCFADFARKLYAHIRA